MKRRLTMACFVVALLLPLGLAAMPPSAQAAAPSCPKVLFLGLHGVNDGGVALPRAAQWGSTIDAVWQTFSSRATGVVTGRPIVYKRTVVDISITNLWLASQLAAITPDTDYAAGLLKDALLDNRLRCGGTKVVLAGYSQGAWAIDKALRGTYAAGALGQLAVSNVKGAFLMGDPAYPDTSNGNGSPVRQGMATWLNMGYNRPADYLNNHVAGFRSICVSYTGDPYDPICMGRGGIPWSDIGVHSSYAGPAQNVRGVLVSSHGASDGGAFLADRVNTP